MSFRHMYQEPQSERLLQVVLEQPQYGGSEHRHIRATVVRRAVSHVANKDHPDQIDTYWDDKVATGYRVASYVLTKTSGTYVDDMQLRGQMDVRRDALNGGRPYGNQVDFRPYSVDQNTARAINDFYTKYSKFLDANNLGRHNDNFYVALCNLATFLKITKLIFSKRGVTHSSLADANAFDEMHINSGHARIEEMLAPFLTGQ